MKISDKRRSWRRMRRRKRCALPCSPLALLEQLGGGGGDADGRTTGAKALFCLTAAEKEKTPWEELQLETAIVGLEGTTGTHTHTRSTSLTNLTSWVSVKANEQ